MGYYQGYYKKHKNLNFGFKRIKLYLLKEKIADEAYISSAVFFNDVHIHHVSKYGLMETLLIFHF
nr:hypothetical protein BN167_1200028 [Clostridioides difficile E13]